MDYQLADNWKVTVVFKSYGLGSSDALDKLSELTVNFCVSVSVTYPEMRQIAREILKEKLEMENDQLKHLVLSTLTLTPLVD